MMEIITKKTKVPAGTLDYGDVFQTDAGNTFMVINAPNTQDCQVAIVNLEKGTVDRIHKSATVRPIKLIAREE